MRSTGKSFRMMMQSLYIASKSKQDVILWVGNRHEVTRISGLLKQTAAIYFGKTLGGPDRVVLPFGVTIYIKNIQNVAQESRSVHFQDMQELMDPIDDEDLIEFTAFRQRHGHN